MTRLPNGADAICSGLKSAGIDIVFGVPGTQTVALYEALRQAQIRTVTASHELAATFMAQGYYRASGRLAAVSAIPGPGFAFALAALPEASLDSAALVLLTGAPADCPHGRRRAQSIDQRTMAGPVVKAVIDISDAAQAAHAVKRACALALSGEPGPVLVQVAEHVWRETPPSVQSTSECAESTDPADADALRNAVEFVASARRILFYAGQGAVDAADDLRRLVSGLGALFATTSSGRGILPEDDDRVLAVDATWDFAGFNSVVRECDAVVVLGAALAENGTVGFGLEFPRDRLVRVDLSEAVLAAPPAARFSVRTSCREFVAELLDAVARDSEPTPRSGFDAVSARAMRARLRDRRSGGPSDARVGGGEAGAFFAALRRGLPADSCLVLDSGMHQLLARRHFVVTQPRGLLLPADFQSMAFGLPEPSAPSWQRLTVPP
jgi:acetolactate synthase-1/2/3 large subunit